MAGTRVIGRERLKRKLTVISAKSKPAIRAAIAKSADEIVAMMRGLVPVDSGALRGSIDWTWGDPPEGTTTFFKTARGDPDLTATIFAGNRDAYYARWVEFGTVKSSPRPFFFPAYQTNRKRAASRIKRAANKAARDEA
jgi:HK97 gp10 family phage protein